MMRTAEKIALASLLFLLWAWATAAIYFSNLPSAWLRTLAAGAFALGFLLAFTFLSKRGRTAIVFLLTFAGVATWWNLIPATGEGDWRPEVAVMASAEFRDNKVTVRKIRNFDYKTENDFTVRYHDRTFDLNKVESVDFVICYWGGLRAVAHTMFSFGFEGGDRLVLSVEVRNQKGREFSTIKGFFKQYELIYVLGDERDLIRLRTNYRGEQVYLYPTTFPRHKTRELLESVLHRINELAAEPEFYNTLGNNCTTNLLDRLNEVSEDKVPYHRKILLNGYTDELAYERGRIAVELPFDEARKACYITDIASKLNDDPDFSEKIRRRPGS